jgi:flagellar basal body rod protein FlgF
MKTITIKLVLSALFFILNTVAFAQDSLLSESSSKEPCCSIEIIDTLDLVNIEDYDIEIGEDGQIIENPIDKLIMENDALLKQAIEGQQATVNTRCCA